MAEYTFHVAFNVIAPSRQEAEIALAGVLPTPNATTPTCWWIAEDDRLDGSDNDSAVFVPKGSQADAGHYIEVMFNYPIEMQTEGGR